MVKAVIFAVVFFALAAGTGCGPSTPSKSQAQKVSEASFAGMMKDGARLIYFRKLNAVRKEIEGQKIYEYSFLAAYEMPAGYAWQKGGLTAEQGFVKDPGVSTGPWGVRYYSIAKGSTAVQRGKIIFRQTEMGWMSNDLPDRSDVGYCNGKDDVVPEVCLKNLGWDNPNY
jgi:hypothetical protein